MVIVEKKPYSRTLCKFSQAFIQYHIFSSPNFCGRHMYVFLCEILSMQQHGPTWVGVCFISTVLYIYTHTVTAGVCIDCSVHFSSQ